MTTLAYLLFVLIALAAAGFAAGPVLWRLTGRGRLLLGAAVALLVLGIGGGLYLYLGQPALAVRALKGADDRSPNALIGRLGIAVRTHPADPRGWALLGQAYAAAHDYQDAANAFGRSIDAAAGLGRHYSFLYSAYGEALTQGAAGAVTPEAEAAFGQAIALDPKDVPARYFLGLAEAARGNAPAGLRYWNSLLGDTPPDSPLHAELVDRIAALTARGGGGPPDVAAMVAGLAARLKAEPDDPAGWQRLIRAYAVLGDKDKALAALADARKAAAGRSDQLAALAAEAKQLGL
ncbi:MAG: tetratricopeptide repeat protein [Rhizomicrobium sp.]